MKRAFCRVSIFFFIVVLIPGLWGNPGSRSIEAVYDDPFLLFYLRNNPTININRSGNLSNKHIYYRNFENKIVDYGDADTGTEQYSSFLFRDRKFYGIDSIDENERGIQRYKSVEILYNAGGSITFNHYRVGSNQFTRDDYRWRDDILIANEGLRFGGIASVIKKDDFHYYYYRSYRRYQSNPELPDTTMALQDNQVIVTSYDMKKVVSVFYFIDGILMKTEDFHGRTLTYTVSSGIGEIVVTINGEVTEVKKLERRIDDEGFLVYEGVQNADGTGYEWVYINEE
jgi:hypothetical protein